MQPDTQKLGCAQHILAFEVSLFHVTFLVPPEVASVCKPLLTITARKRLLACRSKGIIPLAVITLHFKCGHFVYRQRMMGRLKEFLPVWILVWVSKESFVPKLLSQVVQVKRAGPWADSSCFLKLLLSENLLEQFFLLHMNPLFSSSWVRLWLTMEAAPKTRHNYETSVGKVCPPR